MRLERYNPTLFPFRASVANILGTNDLERLHEQDGAPLDVVKTGKDNHTPWHDRFYSGINNGSDFMTVFMKFVREFSYSIFREPIVIQSRPTFRIHWKGNLSVGSFHKDSEYNHQVEELNFWVPLTECYGNNTIWIESKEDRGDFHPVRCNYGDVLIFDGGRLTHGNKINDSQMTRLSFDFRVMRKSEYRESDKVGLGHGKKRCLGEYYSLVEI